MPKAVKIAQMVLLHVARCARFIARGFLEQRGKPPVGVFDETRTSVYCGIRMIDAFMHVNNANYLQIFEFGRWHQGAAQNLFSIFRAANMYPVVAGAHIQYLTPIMPMKTVTVSTRLVHVRGKFWTLRQLIYDQSGRTVHAEALFRIALIDTASEKAAAAAAAAGAADGQPKRRGPTTLTAEEAVKRLGFDPEVIEAQLAEVWKNDIGGGIGDVMKTTDVLDDDWRRALREHQQELRSKAKKL